MKTLNNCVGEIFIYAPGGTSKMFLLRLIFAAIRSQDNIELHLASSGIYVTLLPDERTAHFTLKLPLNMQFLNTPTCNISKIAGMGRVLQKSKFIVYKLIDECRIADKISLEALDQSVQDMCE